MVFETTLPGLCASLSLTAFVCTSKGDSELNRNLGNFANLIVTNRSQNHISYKLMHYSRTLVAFNWQRGAGGRDFALNNRAWRLLGFFPIHENYTSF